MNTYCFITALSPHIDNAVTGQYGELTQYALFVAEILNIKRLESGSSFSFEVVVRIIPFEGAVLLLLTIHMKK